MSSRTRMTRRELLASGSVALSAMALTGAIGACSPGRPAASQPVAPGAAVGQTSTPPVSSSAATPAINAVTSAATEPTTAATPRRGGTLRIGHTGFYPTLEGQTVLPSTNDLLWSMWDRLSAYDNTMQPQPMLAESWEIKDDYTQIKFNLRRGVEFHTGRELSADDVKWSIQRVQDPRTGSSLTGRAQPIVGIETPDKYTVVVKASRPWIEAFDFFEFVNIIDPVTFQDVGLSKPTGTGPFVFAEFVQGDHLSLVRNANYWQKDRPYLDEVVSLIRDGQSAVTQLEAGALDLFGYQLPFADAVRLRQDSSYQVLINTAAGTTWNLYANCTIAPTNNKLVRQALNYALDRKRIAQVVWHGLAQPVTLPWSPTSQAYDASKSEAFGFDLDQASSLLAKAGVSGINLDLQWSTASDDFAIVAQIYQADLAKIGVGLTLKPLSPPVFIDFIQNKKYQGLSYVQGTNGQLQPAGLLQGGLYDPATNSAGFKDDAYTQLVNEVLSVTDPARQKSLYAQLNDYFLDQSWVLPVTQNPPRVAARANVHGLRYDAHETPVLSDVWLT
jgi:peptide/nickel transport system substrate-binding protein